MNSSQKNTGPGPDGPQGSSTSRTPAAADDLLFGDAIFGAKAPTPAPRAAAARAHGESTSVLRLAVKGLKPMERDLLEGLVKVSQRRTPRLQILNDAMALEADVIVIDAHDAAAMAWAHARSWLAERAVIWIDGAEAAPGHTLLRRPVQWPVLPMVLARALESGPGAHATSGPGAVAQARVPPHLPRGHAPHLLIVDDSAAVRTQLRSLLEPVGYDVTEVDSVAGAMQQIEQHRFDGVLIEAALPQIDGYEGCRRVKARLRGADAIPVVMLSSKGSAFDRIRGTMAGCDAYLTKPIDPKHLYEVMAQQSAGPGALAPAPALRPAHRVEIPTRRY